MAAKTVLFDTHVAAGARMVDFGGWDMPLHYGSQKEEHHAVRSNAGLFDVEVRLPQAAAGQATLRIGDTIATGVNVISANKHGVRIQGATATKASTPRDFGKDFAGSGKIISIDTS